VLAAVILSAGESSRMGSPKALVPFRGRTFLQRLLDVVQQSSARIAAGNSAAGKVESSKAGAGIGLTRIVLGARADEIRDTLGLDPATIIINPRWQNGQLSSIQAAISGLAESQTDGVLLFLVDHPLVSAPVVTELVARFYDSGHPIVLPKFRGKRGHPVIFAQRLYGELLAAPAEQGARAVVWQHAAEVLEVPTEDEGVVLNLNDPESLRRALEDPSFGTSASNPQV
jgi:molybdenum cofactor cytidylyltransferase